MRAFRTYLSTCLLLVVTLPAGWAQALDSLPIELGYQEFMRQVLAQHPMARSAELTPDKGAAYLQAARGNFDPVLQGDLDDKQFDGTNYWRNRGAGITLPTPLPVTLEGGFRQTDGQFLNPELVLPSEGLINAGAEVNLGKGLLIDERRAALQKARIYAERSEAERILLLNDLMVDAARAYWSWVEAYNAAEIYREAVDLAETRFAGVVNSFRQGAVPAIDTTEALIQVQIRRYSLNEGLLKRNASRLKLSTYLWDESGEPLELLPTVGAPAVMSQPDIADDLPVGGLERPSDSLPPDHPLMRYYGLQLDELQVERRYKAEQLKPKVALKYNWLSGPEAARMAQPFDNYKVGVSVAFPLFLRTARGELTATKLSIQQAELNLAYKRQDLNNQLADVRRRIAITENQIQLYIETVENYQRLLAGEVQRYQSGESSLFLVNRREQNLIKAELQLLQQRTTYPVLLAEQLRIAGGLMDWDGN